MIRKGLAVALLSLGALALTGCAGAPDVERVRWEIERNVPGARFEREEHFHLGRIAMGLLRTVARMTPADPESIRPLRQVRSVEVGVYRVESLPDLDRASQAFANFEERLSDHGWSLMLRDRQADSRTWMLVRSHPDGWLSNLFIVTLEPEEMTLVRVDGRLDQLFAEAAAKDPKRFVREASQEDRPEPAPQPETQPTVP
jgi:hypothetical protein